MTVLRGLFALTASALGLVAGANTVSAQEWRPEYSMYGTVGIIEMPSALSAKDADLSSQISAFEDQTRVSITFQILPRLSGTFRYSIIPDYTGVGTATLYDRSFDFQYRLLDESEWRPAVAVGLRDFMGTGVLTSEYVVGTKTIGTNLRATGGIGWGRMGSYNGFTNPLGAIASAMETRPSRSSAFGVGGVPAYDLYFRGDAAFFGGVEWQINPSLTFAAEYSSDAYEREVSNGTFEHKSPFNFGLKYHPNESYELGLYALYGSEIGVTATSVLNPNRRPANGGYDAAPMPVVVRPEDLRAARTWDRSILPDQTIEAALVEALGQDGIVVQGIELTDTSIRLRYENTKYRSEAQAIGRVSRVLTYALPPSVETFIFEPTRLGVPTSATTIKRSDLEQLENQIGSAEAMFSRANVAEAMIGDDPELVASQKGNFQWGIVPYGELTLFDSRNPATVEVGIEAVMRYEIRPNIVVAGAVRKSAYDNRIDNPSISAATIEPVRRYAPYYADQGDGGIDYLTFSWYGRPAAELYSRVTFGYLEPMFGGISTELLWKPVDSDLAFGVELNYTAQRDFDQGFGFQDYDVLTGHLSAYWSMQNDFHVQVDAGRYLAGDWGATVSVDREFQNGWRIGAYATFTDVPFEDFGEGSFDKGIRLTIPMDWATGMPSTQLVETRLSSLTRDGGARVEVDGRLYDAIRSGDISDFGDSWGRFWR